MGVYGACLQPPCMHADTLSGQARAFLTGGQLRLILIAVVRPMTRILAGVKLGWSKPR